MIEARETARPEKFGTRGAWQYEAGHMRSHPGQTFVIDRREYPNKAAYALAAHVRTGGYVAFRPAGAFDAWVERSGENLEVVAMYNGPDGGATTPAPVAGETVAEPEPGQAPTPPGRSEADSGGTLASDEDLAALRAKLGGTDPKPAKGRRTVAVRAS